MTKEKFSIRKTLLGAASVQVATLTMLGGAFGPMVSADTVDVVAESNLEVITETVTQADIDVAKTEVADAQAQVSTAQAEVSNAIVAEQDAQAEVDHLTELTTLAEEATPELVAEYEALVDDLTADTKVDETIVAEAEQKVATATQAENVAEKAVADATTVLNQKETEVNQLTTVVEATKVDIVATEKAIATEQTKATAAETTIDTQTKVVADATTEVSTLESKLKDAQALETEKTNLDKTVQSVQNQLDKLTTAGAAEQLIAPVYPIEFFDILESNRAVLRPYPQGSGLSVRRPSQANETWGISYDDYLTSLGVDDKTRADIYRMLEIADNLPETAYVPSEADKNHVIAGPQLTSEEVLELNTFAVKWLNQATKTYRETRGYGEYLVNPTLTKIAENHTARILETAHEEGYLRYEHNRPSLVELKKETTSVIKEYHHGGENASWKGMYNELVDYYFDFETGELKETWSPVTMATLKKALIEDLHGLFGDDSNPEFQHLKGFFYEFDRIFATVGDDNVVVALGVALTPGMGGHVDNINMTQAVGGGFYFNMFRLDDNATGHPDDIKVGEHGVENTTKAQQINQLTTQLTTLKQEQAKLATKQATVGTVASVQNQLATAKETLAAANTKVATAIKELEEANAKVKNLTAGLVTKQATLSAKEADLTKAKEDLTALRADLLAKQATYKTAQANASQARQILIEAKTLAADTKNSLEQATKEYNFLKGVLEGATTAKEELTKAQAQLTKAAEARKAAQDKLNLAIQARDEKQAKLDELLVNYKPLTPVVEEEPTVVKVPVVVGGATLSDTPDQATGNGYGAGAGHLAPATGVGSPTPLNGQSAAPSALTPGAGTPGQVARAQAEKTLPSTGEGTSVLTLVGLGMVGLGLVGRKRRQG